MGRVKSKKKSRSTKSRSKSRVYRSKRDKKSMKRYKKNKTRKNRRSFIKKSRTNKKASHNRRMRGGGSGGDKAADFVGGGPSTPEEVMESMGITDPTPAIRQKVVEHLAKKVKKQKQHEAEMAAADIAFTEHGTVATTSPDLKDILRRWEEDAESKGGAGSKAEAGAQGGGGRRYRTGRTADLGRI